MAQNIGERRHHHELKLRGKREHSMQREQRCPEHGDRSGRIGVGWGTRKEPHLAQEGICVGGHQKAQLERQGSIGLGMAPLKARLRVRVVSGAPLQFL